MIVLSAIVQTLVLAMIRLCREFRFSSTVRAMLVLIRFAGHSDFLSNRFNRRFAAFLSRLRYMSAEEHAFILPKDYSLHQRQPPIKTLRRNPHCANVVR